jgi:hypothetical protein
MNQLTGVLLRLENNMEKSLDLSSVFGDFYHDTLREAEATEFLGDDFLVGCSANSYEFDIKDMFSDDETLEEIDDLHEFSLGRIRVDNVKNLYLETKKGILSRFDYFVVKSKEFGNRPIKVSDMAFNQSDSYVINYLEDSGKCYESIIIAMAKLSAYTDLGFFEVFSHYEGDCPLRRSFNGQIFGISYLSDVFMTSDSDFLVDCDYIPVVNRDISSNFTLNKDIEIAGKFVKNFPAEFGDRLTKRIENLVLSSSGDIDEIEFSLATSRSGDAMILKNKKLFIDNSSIGFYNSIVFLDEWAYEEEDKEPVIIDALELEGESFMWNGREVIEFNGTFIDIRSNKIVNELTEVISDLEDGAMGFQKTGRDEDSEVTGPIEDLGEDKKETKEEEK